MDGRKVALLDELAFASFTTSLRLSFASPGLRAMWMIVRVGYEAEFAAFMDTIVGEAGDRPRADQFTQWKATVSAELDCLKAA